MENWAKSSYCTTAANCVETRAVGVMVDIRDSKETGRGHIGVRAEAWQAFVKSMQ